MKPFRILLVDDHQSIRFTFRVALESEGHDVALAGSAAETLEMTARQRFDLLILDLRLGADSGTQLLADLRDRGVDSAALMMTAHGTVADAVAAMKLGAIDFLAKPLDPARLRAAVVDIVERRHAADRAARAAAPLEGTHAHQIIEAKHALNCRDFDAARGLLARALETNDHSADAHYLYGVLQELNDRHDDARRYYRRALDLYAEHNLAAQLKRLGTTPPVSFLRKP